MSSVALFRKLQELDPAVREAILMVLEIWDQRLSEQVTKSEFEEMRALLAEVVQIQKRTEENLARLTERVDRLEQVVAELAEAQKRTEERLNQLAEAQKRTEERLNQLAEAQKRTEERLNQLAEAQKRTEERLNQLAEAQKRTEERLNQLAEAQKRTEENLARLTERVDRLEQVVAELAEAQKRTEENLARLTRRVDLLQSRVEGLSNTIGYTLENQAYKALPDILQQHGIQVVGRLKRIYMRVGDRERQINIYGHGRQDGQEVLIIGETKTRPSKSEAQRFLNLVERLKQQEGKPIVSVFVAHDFPPAVENYLKAQHVLVIWSYDLE